MESTSHPLRIGQFIPAAGDETLIDAITTHLAQHLDPPSSVLHELSSDLVHVDVHLVAPRSDRPFITLVSSGMSERAMRDDDGRPVHAELAICLPSDWPGLDDRQTLVDLGDPRSPLSNPDNAWPIHWLQRLARLPHQTNRRLWLGHSVPNGQPPAPLASNTRQCALMLVRNPLLPEAFHEIRLPDRHIVVFSVLPIHPSELQFKLEHGATALLEKLDRAGVFPIVDVDRPPAV